MDSFKTSFDLNICIQSLSQMVKLSKSYEKSKLDKDWETHSLIIKQNYRFWYIILMKTERHISLAHLLSTR